MKRISLFLAMALLLAVVPMGAWAEAIAPDGLDLVQEMEAADEAIELPELDVPDPVSEAIPAPQGEAAENAGDVAINKANFPDKVFREYVKHQDDDGDGKLSRAEIKAVKEIYLDGMRGITSLKGIEHFVNLTYLHCQDHKLKSLDVSKNRKLIGLNCSNNPIKLLDVSKNRKLEDLNCSDTLISSLDASKNSKLYSLWAENTPLTSIKLGRNDQLWELRLAGTKLASVDISSCSYIVESVTDRAWSYSVSKGVIDWHGGQSAHLNVNISTKVMNGRQALYTYARPKTFQFSRASVILKLNDTDFEDRNFHRLLNRIPANSVYKTTFTCDKKGIIELNKDTGYGWPLKKGTVTVTARSGGKKATIKVIVK